MHRAAWISNPRIARHARWRADGARFSAAAIRGQPGKPCGAFWNGYPWGSTKPGLLWIA